MPEPFERFVDVLKQDGWRVDLESSLRRQKQPKLMTIARGTIVQPLRVYIWNVTPGGPATVRSREEYRIQKMTHSPFELGGGYTTLLLGWYQLLDIFVAWDVAAHEYAKYSASIQVHTPYLEEARIRGIAIEHRDPPKEDVVVVTSDLLSSYLEEAVIIHGRQFSNTDVTFPELDFYRIEEAEEKQPTEQHMRGKNRIPSPGPAKERQRVARSLTQWWRSSTFPRTVTWAYDYQCATCGIGLELIQAAHIVPVSEPTSTDLPSNGIALCPLHHAAYDAGIYGVDENYVNVLNEAKIVLLTERERAAGFDKFRSITPVGQRITLPVYEPYRPDPELLRRALDLRGFQ